MKIPDGVLQLINKEQERQAGVFVPLEDTYLEKLSNHAELIVHQKNNEILGFVFFYCNDPNRIFSYITLIATSDSARGIGIGTALINYVLNLTKLRGFKFCHLEVRKNNEPALKLYEKIGFISVEDRGEKILMSYKLG